MHTKEEEKKTSPTFCVSSHAMMQCTHARVGHGERYKGDDMCAVRVLNAKGWNHASSAMSLQGVWPIVSTEHHTGQWERNSLVSRLPKIQFRKEHCWAAKIDSQPRNIHMIIIFECGEYHHFKPIKKASRDVVCHNSTLK